MGVKTVVIASADKLDQIAAQLAEGLTNLTGDIANLSGQLAEAGTEEEILAILQPKLDAMQAVADNLTALAAVTPDAPVVEPPPVEPPPEEEIL